MTNIAEAIRRGKMDEESTFIFGKHFSHVEITTEPAEPSLGIGERLMVSPVWKGVDRPRTSGHSVGMDRKLANRLKMALESGKAFCSVSLAKDNDGESYIQAVDLTMNADLKRLRF